MRIKNIDIFKKIKIKSSEDGNCLIMSFIMARIYINIYKKQLKCKKYETNVFNVCHQFRCKLSNFFLPKQLEQTTTKPQSISNTLLIKAAFIRQVNYIKLTIFTVLWWYILITSSCSTRCNQDREYY